MDKIEKEIEWYEGLTHVYVAFPNKSRGLPYVDIQGEFCADELSKIASILRKLEKRASKPVQQETLWSKP